VLFSHLKDFTPVCTTTELWTRSRRGISEVRTTSLDLSMEFSSFDDFWLPFLGGATSTSTFAATTNQKTGVLSPESFAT
jgi:hypothetical protein